MLAVRAVTNGAVIAIFKAGIAVAFFFDRVAVANVAVRDAHSNPSGAALFSVQIIVGFIWQGRGKAWIDLP
jgi:hypothetical protein